MRNEADHDDVRRLASGELFGPQHGLIEADKFIKENKQDAAKIAGAKVNVDMPGTLRLWEIAGWSWNLYWDDAAIDSLQEVANWMKTNDRIQTTPDWSKHVNAKWLKAVDPARVKLSKYPYA